jgi:hypothetical protein
MTIGLVDYAEVWIDQRPGLRSRTIETYRGLLRRHIVPHLGNVPLGKIDTPMIRDWRARLLHQGVSVSETAKAYRVLRAAHPAAGTKPPPLHCGHRSLLFMIAPIGVACHLVGFTDGRRSLPGAEPSRAWSAGLSRCFGRAEAQCAREFGTCGRARPKDLGTLDGSRGGLIIPRRVKAALPRLGALQCPLPLRLVTHAPGCQDGGDARVSGGRSP